MGDPADKEENKAANGDKVVEIPAPTETEKEEDPVEMQRRLEEEAAARKKKEAYFQKKSQELRRERGRRKAAFTRLRSKLSTLMVEGKPPSEINLRLDDLTACFRELEYTHEEYVSYILDDEEYKESIEYINEVEKSYREMLSLIHISEPTRPY